MKKENYYEAFKKMDKIIVVMVGGLSYSEINSIQTDPLDKNSQIIIAASNLINPKDFVDSLSQGKKGNLESINIEIK